MTTITKERIELFIKNPLENGLTRGEQMELARIALASWKQSRLCSGLKNIKKGLRHDDFYQRAVNSSRRGDY